MVEERRDVVDATRRTRLANERTYLAWWRSALTAYAASIGFGKLVPVLADVRRWPYAVVGVAFAAVGTVFVGYGVYRYRAVEAALDRGDYAAPDTRFVLAVAAVGVVLGLATVVLVIVAS